MLLDFTIIQIIFTSLIFIWTGFVRSALGFGGAALGLPLLLFIDEHVVLWLPIIGAHLLFFTSLTLNKRLHFVDWKYLKTSSFYIIPAALIGVLGLLNLPTILLNVFIYSITLFYGTIWALNYVIQSQYKWMDNTLLALGGYIAGTSLTGAPLIMVAFVRNVAKERLRDTLFTLWFILVMMKMLTFVGLGVNLHIMTAILLLPIAAIGHILGLKVHDKISQSDLVLKRWIGISLIALSIIALLKLYF